MMKKILFICLFFPVVAYSQTTITDYPDIHGTLQKYWNYRARLEKYFVVVSSSNAMGTNIPADHVGGNVIDYNDGNENLQYYIGMLATEYALLKMNHLDYTRTKNELLWALEAVNRLDLNAEKYYRSDGSVNTTTDLNGFFLRDDVTDAFKTKLAPELSACTNLSINSVFKLKDACQPKKGCVNCSEFIDSHDNITHYLLNLALVVKLVDDSQIKTLAQNIAYRMVKNFWHVDLAGTETHWYITLPVCGKSSGSGNVDLKGCKDIGLGVCEQSALDNGNRYSYAAAGNWITQGSGLPNLWQRMIRHPGKEGTVEASFYNPLTWLPAENNKALRPLQRAILATIIGNTEWSKFRPYDLYDYLDAQTHEMFTDYTDNPNRGYVYEHLPLICHILHPDDPSNFDPYSFSEIEFYLDLFDRLYDVDVENIDLDWMSDNRLVSNPNFDHENFDLSHIDFMLDYNLFRLVYVEGAYPPYITNSGNSCNKTIVATKAITESSTVSSGCSLVDIAGSYITIEPGFYVEKGSTFEAKISSKLDDYKYDITSADNTDNSLHYLSCSKSAESPIENNAVTTTETKTVNNSTLTIYPNPTEGDLNIKLTGMEGKKQLKVFDMSGVTIYTNSFNQNKYMLDMHQYPSGLYYIQITNSKVTIEQKFVLQ